MYHVCTTKGGTLLRFDHDSCECHASCSLALLDLSHSLQDLGQDQCPQKLLVLVVVLLVLVQLVSDHPAAVAGIEFLGTGP